MTINTKKLHWAIAIAFCLLSINANAEQKHIIERGENLESIARKYGVTTQQIIELNPDAATFTYVGMELVIPDTTVKPTSAGQTVAPTQTNSNAQLTKEARPADNAPASLGNALTASATENRRSYPTSDQSPANDSAKESDSEYNIFSMAALVTWDYCVSGEGGDFKSRSAYGFYAEGCSELSPNFGLGVAFGFEFNFGLVPKNTGSMLGMLGPTLALSLGGSKTAALFLPVCVGMGYSAVPGQDDIAWSCLILPHFGFSLNRVRINAGCHINTDFDNTTVGIQVGIGYEF